MKILLTQRALEKYSGSELYTAEVARGLKARGHDVAVYCPRPGQIARLISSNGIVVADATDALPFVPDVIHGQHHLPLMAALARFEGVPAVHVWHGARPWVEEVPHHPRIVRRIVTSGRMRPLMAAEHGIPEDRIDLIPNTVDTDRFSHVRTVPDRPHSATLFGHGGFYAHELRMLEEACVANGLTLEKIGYPYNNPRPRPEYALPDFDMVFAIGRSALEAMACGCAVIPIVPQLAGTRITMDTLDDWAEANYSPRYYRSADRFDTAWLRGQIAAWDPVDIARVTQEVRRRFTFQAALDAFEASYARAVADAGTASGQGEFAGYLGWLAGEVNDMWESRNVSREEVTVLTARTERLREDLAQAEGRVRHLMQLLLAERGIATEPAANSHDEAYRVIVAAGVFDPAWYLDTYPEVAEAGIDPLEHYLEFGVVEGRRPTASFDPEAYWAANPHLKGLGATALESHARQMLMAADLSKAGDGDG
ncbi:glycosyltransferase [Pseudaestuariivita atlantica]|uniref:glycosyltransferase n=1 Tax=Pseudaestuariivita atlantica TaxID=1317121 RepID=UPI000A4BE14D|nr:glycosyltransferase [Pseudaestuariivita atlantica]